LSKVFSVAQQAKNLLKPPDATPFYQQQLPDGHEPKSVGQLLLQTQRLRQSLIRCAPYFLFNLFVNNGL
jgi:hypothetical protein